MVSRLSWYPEQETLEAPLFVSSPSLTLHIKSMAKGVSLNFNYVQINIQPKSIYFLNPSHHELSYLDYSKSLCDGHLRFPSQWLMAPANALWNPSVFTLRPCFPRQKKRGMPTPGRRRTPTLGDFDSWVPRRPCQTFIDAHCSFRLFI